MQLANFSTLKQIIHSSVDLQVMNVYIKTNL